MIAAVRVAAVALGIGAGALVATVAAFVFWIPLAWAGIEAAPLIGLTFAVVIGLVAGGFVSGRLAPAFWRFHGALAGFGMAVLVLVIARLGGSPAPTSRVLLLAALGIALGGLGGVLGGRRRNRPKPVA